MQPEVLIAPANFAGQGYRWASALERAGVPAVAWERTLGRGFGYPVDTRDGVAEHRASRRWQQTVFDEVVSTVRAVVLEAGRPLFGGLFGYDAAAEARALQRAGLRVATMWHGTDVRLPSVHRAGHPWSVFADRDAAAWRAALEAGARRNRRRLAGLDAPILVSTPDLLPGLPGASWVPVVVEPDVWAAPAGLRRERPVILHLPSNPRVKGGRLIEPVLRRLEGEGLLEYRTPGWTAADDVPALVASADVVLDQFRLGIYGVAACEAMAAGRLVVSMVDDQVRDAVRDATGLELPIVQATPDDLESVLRSVLEDVAAAEATAARGPGFVRAVHDGRRSAEVLIEQLLS